MEIYLNLFLFQWSFLSLFVCECVFEKECFEDCSTVQQQGIKKKKEEAVFPLFFIFCLRGLFFVFVNLSTFLEQSFSILIATFFTTAAARSESSLNSYSPSGCPSYFQIGCYFKCCSTVFNRRTVVSISFKCNFLLVLIGSDKDVEKPASKRWSSPIQCRPCVETKTKQSKIKPSSRYSYAFWECTVWSRRTKLILLWTSDSLEKNIRLVRYSFEGKTKFGSWFSKPFR